MFWALACIAAVTVVYLIRAPRRLPVPARILPGDSVVTDDGTEGVVVQLDGSYTLIRIDDEHAAWASTGSLMQSPTTISHGHVSADEQAALPSPSNLQDSGTALARFADGVYRARRMIVGGWILVLLASLPLAATAEKAFVNGGFLIKDGEAIGVLNEMQNDFQVPVARQTMILPGSQREVQERLDKLLPQLYRIPYVMVVGEVEESQSGDHSAFVIGFSVADDQAIDAFEPIVELFESAGYEREEIQVAGSTAVFADTNTQMKRDLAQAEAIGLPLALIVLLLVFGTVVAASVPLFVGVASVIITLAILHVLSIPLGLSIFVMNIASMLGLGLGIDYSLLGVSRFREELDRGQSVYQATITTVVTSGRAATISGVAVVAGVAALAAIPLPVMLSIAIGGVVVVAITVLASLTLLPAVLAMLGHRIERFKVRNTSAPSNIESSRWYRLAKIVMRRPGSALIVGVLILLILANPVRGARLDVPHSEVISQDSPSQLAVQRLTEDFGKQVESPVIIALDSAKKDDLKSARKTLLAQDEIVRVEVVSTLPEEDKSLILAHPKLKYRNGGVDGRALAGKIAELQLSAPSRVSGAGAGEAEFLNVVKTGMPRTLILMFVSTLIILTVAFRSLTIPIKAILLDTLSILASLGVVVAVFQNGFGIELLGAEALGYTESTIPIILFCLLFGLSMDYEVFMLAKVTEYYQQGYDYREATARGVAATAPLVTGAALILIVLGIAFATTQLVLVKQIGFGMAVALALDATIVRVFLLPATMRLLGPANWWLPKPLLRRIPRAEWSH